jgi:hypothetical protein
MRLVEMNGSHPLINEKIDETLTRTWGSSEALQG